MDEVLLALFGSSIQMRRESLLLSERGPSICWSLHAQSSEPPADTYIDSCVSLFKTGLEPFQPRIVYQWQMTAAN